MYIISAKSIQNQNDVLVYDMQMRLVMEGRLFAAWRTCQVEYRIWVSEWRYDTDMETSHTKVSVEYEPRYLI